MRHSSVATTEKYYVGIQSDETAAMLEGLVVYEPEKVVVEVVVTKKGSPKNSETP